jgi:hypothetical protein
MIGRGRDALCHERAPRSWPPTAQHYVLTPRSCHLARRRPPAVPVEAPICCTGSALSSGFVKLPTLTVTQPYPATVSLPVDGRIHRECAPSGLDAAALESVVNHKGGRDLCACGFLRSWIRVVG